MTCDNAPINIITNIGGDKYLEIVLDKEKPPVKGVFLRAQYEKKQECVTCKHHKKQVTNSPIQENMFKIYLRKIINASVFSYVFLESFLTF